MSGNSRPTGISILSILNILGGIFLVLAGVALTIASFLIEDIFEPYLIEICLTVQLAQVMGVILAVFGIFSIVVGYGLWNGKSWGRIIVIVLYVIGLISVSFYFIGLSGEYLIGVISVGDLLITITPPIVSSAICVIVIYYLTRPHVKSFFGKVEVIERKPTTIAPPPKGETKYCGFCGTEMPADARYCPECGERQ